LFSGKGPAPGVATPRVPGLSRLPVTVLRKAPIAKHAGAVAARVSAGLPGGPLSRIEQYAAARQPGADGALPVRPEVRQGHARQPGSERKPARLTTTRVPSASGTCTASARVLPTYHPPCMHAVWKPSQRNTQVLSWNANVEMTKSPGALRCDGER